MKLYILSLWLLFVLIFILTVNIPIYCGSDWEFVGIAVIFKTNIIPIICLVLVIIGIFNYLTFDYKLEGSTNLAFTITNVENANFEHLTFLATYIIPLICFNFGDTRYLVVLFLVLIIIGAIYVKTNIFYANPTLALLGFKLYKAIKVVNNEKISIIIITKDKLESNCYIKTIHLDTNIYYARRT